MTYFECAECGQLADFTELSRSRLRRRCPVCEDETVWETAFEADEGASL